MVRPLSLGAWMQQQRKRLDLTQADLAAQVGCAGVTIKKIEQDARRPSRQLATLLADALAIPGTERELFVAVARGRQPLNASNAAPLMATYATTSAHYFVGRQRELGRLARIFDKMLMGDGQIVFVTGEAGRGKTSLLVEFARLAQARRPDVIVAYGSCNAFAGAGDPYLPFRDVMLMLTGACDTRQQAMIAAHQAESLQHRLPLTIRALLDFGPDLIDVLAPGALLLQRIDADFPQNVSWRKELQIATQRRAERTTSLDQQQIYEQARLLFQSLTTEAPLVLLLDDLQWVDNASLNLLFHLAQRMAGSRLLVIGAYRSSEIAATGEKARVPTPLWTVIHELKRYLGDLEIDLEQASPSENRAFIDALLDRESNQLDDRFRRDLLERTHGYPLFTVELLHAMQERGDLVCDENGNLITGQTLDWQQLPTRVEAAIAQRIGRLPTEQQQVLRVAAIEGELFTAEVVGHVLGLQRRTITHLLSNELSQQARLVEGQGSFHVTGQRLSQYRFRHALFQAYLYQQVDVVERSALHEAVGVALEEFYGAATSEIAAILARHFAAADIVDKACAYLLLAGKRAINLSAYADAAAQLTEGCKLLQQLPPTRERDQLELDLLIPLGVALTATKHIVSKEVNDTYERVQALCQRLEQPLNAPSLRALAIAYLLRGQLQQAHRLGTQLLSLAQDRADQALISEAHYALGVNHFWLGNLALSRRHLERAIDFYEPHQAELHVTTFGWNPKAVCLCRLAYTLWYLGYHEQAIRTAEQAQAFAQALGHPFSLAYVFCFSIWLYLDNRELKKARGMIEEATMLLNKHDFPHWQLMAEILHGRLIAAAGRSEQGVAQMRNAIIECDKLELQSGQPYYYGLLAQIYLERSSSKLGLAAVQTGLQIIRTYGDRHYEAELYRLQGELILLNPHNTAIAMLQAEAETAFRRARQIAKEQESKSLELRVAMSLSRLWREQGKTQDAFEMLSSIYNWFTESFDTPDLLDARALLDQLSG